MRRLGTPGNARERAPRKRAPQYIIVIRSCDKFSCRAPSPVLAPGGRFAAPGNARKRARARPPKRGSPIHNCNTKLRRIQLPRTLLRAGAWGALCSAWERLETRGSAPPEKKAPQYIVVIRNCDKFSCRAPSPVLAPGERFAAPGNAWKRLGARPQKKNSALHNCNTKLYRI